MKCYSCETKKATTTHDISHVPLCSTCYNQEKTEAIGDMQEAQEEGKEVESA